MSPSQPAPATAFQAGQPGKDWQMGGELVLFRAQSPAPPVKQEKLIMSETYRPQLGGIRRLDLGTEHTEPRQTALLIEAVWKLPWFNYHSTSSIQGENSLVSEVRLYGPTTQSSGLLIQSPIPCHKLGKVRLVTFLAGAEGRRHRSTSATLGLALPQTSLGKALRFQPEQARRQGRAVYTSSGEQYKTPCLA